MAGRTLSVITVLSFFCLSCVTAGLVTKCKSDDSKCARTSAQAIITTFANGLPAYNVKTLDPISFKKINASTSDLKLILTDVTIKGMKDCVAKKVKRDKAKNKMFLKFLCSAQLESQYEMNGKLLFFPIEGKGPFHVTLRQMEISVEMDMGEIEKEGVSYWDIKDWKYSYNLKDKSDVVFENLFNGNEVLAQATRDLISDNGNEIIMEVGPATIDTTINAVVDTFRNFFHAIPAQELTID